MGALAIPTKITKGTIEIIKDVDIIKAGDRVGMSEATLLNMLKISPFSYGLVISKVYDSGSVFDPEILDLLIRASLSSLKFCLILETILVLFQIVFLSSNLVFFVAL